MLENVRFSVNYSFDTESQNFIAVIEIFIPAEDKNDSSCLIGLSCRNSNVILFGEELGRSWGYRSEEGRVRTLSISSPDEVELNGKVEEELSEAAQILGDVVRCNWLSQLAVPPYESGYLKDYLPEF